MSVVIGPVLSDPGSNVRKPHGINREAFSFRPLCQERRGDTLEDRSKMQSKISTTQLELFNESALPEAVTLHADRPGAADREMPVCFPAVGLLVRFRWLP